MDVLLITASNISRRFFSTYFYKKFQAYSKIEFYSEDPYIHRLDITINILFITYPFVYFSHYPLIYPNFLMHFQFQASVGFPLKYFSILMSK